MITDWNQIKSEKDLQEFVNLLKRRKSFEDIVLGIIPNIGTARTKKINKTNYENVYVVQKDNVLTFFARFKRKNLRGEVVEFSASLSNVKDAAIAVDKRLLEIGLPPVNFDFKLKPREIKQTKVKTAA